MTALAFSNKTLIFGGKGEAGMAGAKNSVSNYLPYDLGDTLVAHHIAFICGAVSGHMYSPPNHPNSIGVTSIRSTRPLCDESRNFFGG